MKHWCVPGVTTNPIASLPRAKNLCRETEHIYGTSNRDPLSFSYYHIKSLMKTPEILQNYLYTHALRIIFLRLDKSKHPKYESLNVNERLDLALTERILTESLRALVFQIEVETEPFALVAVFVNFLKEFRKSPLEFQPLFNQLVGDKDIFGQDEEVLSLNRNFTRML
jgi:hypothetical protein